MSTPKVADVAEYSGKGSLVDRKDGAEEFLRKCELYFLLVGTTIFDTPAKQVAYALFRLKDEAWAWGQAYAEHLPSALAANPTRGTIDQHIWDSITIWNTFKATFRGQWCAFDQQQAAVQEMSKLKYRGDIAAFTGEFR